ncbi:MAG: anti-sigma factor antagonist [Eubacteriales bacterium]
MNIKHKFDNNILKVIVFGDIDHHNAKKIRDEIDDLLISYRPRTMQLFMSQVDFMDSSGLGIILGRLNKIREMGGEMKIVEPTARILKILSLAGVEKSVGIEKHGSF